MQIPVTAAIEDLRLLCELLMAQNDALKTQLDLLKTHSEAQKATNDMLTTQNDVLKALNEQLTAKVTWLEEQFRLAQHRRFGAASEQTHPDQQLLLIFNEAEMCAVPTAPEPTMETISCRRRKTKGQREAQLERLEVDAVVEHRLAEAEQICPCCGGALHETGKQVRNELKVIPAQVKRVEHVIYTYTCPNCEHNGLNMAKITAPAPAPVIPNSIASPSVVAYIMSRKFVEGLPLYRQEQQFARMDIKLFRQTLSNWIIYCAENWLSPLYDRMYFHLLALDILQADETAVQVLQEPGRAAESKSFMWLYRNGRAGPPIILYEYQPTRAGEHAHRFLTGFSGYLQVDGYVGYEGLPGVTLVGCWAHARRKFDEALKALPKSTSTTGTAAQQGLDFCNSLFMIERTLRNATPEQRSAGRMQKSKPVLDEFKAWLEFQAPRTLPKSALGTAISYCLNQWSKLIVFLEDGRLELDNNRSERSIKPFVIGRKNWLFANSQAGARASAIIYSIVETAKENNLNPLAYLQYVLEQLPGMTSKNLPAKLDALLPWSTTLPEYCRLHTLPLS